MDTSVFSLGIFHLLIPPYLWRLSLNIGKCVNAKKRKKSKSNISRAYLVGKGGEDFLTYVNCFGWLKPHKPSFLFYSHPQTHKSSLSSLPSITSTGSLFAATRPTTTVQPTFDHCHYQSPWKSELVNVIRFCSHRCEPHTWTPRSIEPPKAKVLDLGWYLVESLLQECSAKQLLDCEFALYLLFLQGWGAKKAVIVVMVVFGERVC